MDAPPLFQFAASALDVRGIVGSIAHASLSVANAGGAARGVRVSVWGDSLDRELLVVDHGQLVIARGDPIKVIDAPLELRVSSGESRHYDRHYCAELDIPIAAGSADWVRDLDGERLHLNVQLRVVAAGKGSLCIGFVPMTHADGQAATQLAVHTVEPGQPLPVPAIPDHILAVAEAQRRKPK